MKRLTLLAPFALAAACAPMPQRVIDARAAGDGTTVSYAVSKEDAWRIAVAVFKWEGADIIREEPGQGRIIAGFGWNLVTYGTDAGVWFEVREENATGVTVVTKRRVPTTFCTNLTETTFHSRFAQGVEIVKSGRPLPDRAP